MSTPVLDQVIRNIDHAKDAVEHAEQRLEEIEHTLRKVAIEWESQGGVDLLNSMRPTRCCTQAFFTRPHRVERDGKPYLSFDVDCYSHGDDSAVGIDVPMDFMEEVLTRG